MTETEALIFVLTEIAGAITTAGEGIARSIWIVGIIIALRNLMEAFKK